MSSATEIQSSFDDVIEFPSAGHALAYPLKVSDHFPSKAIARAFVVVGGGNIVVKTAAGESRPLTGLQDPFFSGLKITEITSATAATLVRFYV